MISLEQELNNACIIIRKRIKLTSGHISDFYCDHKKVFENPRLVKRIVGELTKKIKGKVTCVAGTGYGGIPLATAVSLSLNLPLVLVRGEARIHGLKKSIEGYIPGPKDSVAIIEDVCTYGTSLLKIVKALKKTKAKIAGCYVVILRPEMKLPFKYPFYYLTKASDILKLTNE